MKPRKVSSIPAYGDSSSYAQSLGVRAKVILLTYALNTVAPGRAVYRHDRKKTSRPKPSRLPPAARAQC
jgi:hypothetical protein